MPSKAHTGGPLPKITPELVDRIAERLIEGQPISWALAMENERLTPQYWNTQLAKRPILAGRFEKRCGELAAPFFRELHSCTLRNMPAKVWLYERRFPHHFAQPKGQGTSVNVTVNACVGVPDDVSRRAASYVKRKAIQVQVESHKIEDKPS